MVFHVCLLVELGPICNSMAATLCLKSCEDHSLLKSYNEGVWKTINRLIGARGDIGSCTDPESCIRERDPTFRKKEGFFLYMCFFGLYILHILKDFKNASPAKMLIYCQNVVF